jgi:3-dehydrosphinganine reductase
MEVNYFGAVHVSKAVLPGMLTRGSGHIVNIGSIASYVGVFGYTAYGASKFALRGFSDALRAEMKPHGILVSIVYPPDTDTPQLTYENRYKPPELKELLPELGVISPDQVAARVIKGISLNHRVIYADFGSRLIYHLSNLLGNGVYTIQDWLVRRARRKQNKND